MRIHLFTGLALLLAAIAAFSARSPEIPFERKTIDLGVSETCAIGDFNNDGRPDIFSGDAWYENPTWKRHEVRHLEEYGTYLASLSDLPLDVDGDGFIDIVSSGGTVSSSSCAKLGFLRKSSSVALRIMWRFASGSVPLGRSETSMYWNPCGWARGYPEPTLVIFAPAIHCAPLVRI